MIVLEPKRRRPHLIGKSGAPNVHTLTLGGGERASDSAHKGYRGLNAGHGKGVHKHLPKHRYSNPGDARDGPFSPVHRWSARSGVIRLSSATAASLCFYAAQPSTSPTASSSSARSVAAIAAWAPSPFTTRSAASQISGGAVDHLGIRPYLDRIVADPRDDLFSTRTRNTVLRGLEQFDADYFSVLAHEATTVPRHGFLALPAAGCC